MFISFGWTAPPVLAGVKDWTWRRWKPTHAAHFHEGDVVDAYDRSPRNHGVRIGRVRLTCDPVLTTSDTVTSAMYETEGLAYLAAHPELCPKRMFGKAFTPDLVSREHFEAWRASGEEGYIVRFEVVELVG